MKIEASNFVGFFRPSEKNGYLSNWFNSRFTVDGVTFQSGEQYMMYSKAILFGDKLTVRKILNTTNNAEIKKLGREVKPFNPIIWDKECKEIMFKGLYEKFNQNKRLKSQLLSTGDSILAECSPYDAIWGIKMDIENPRRLDTSQWLGKNYLGEVLMRVRDELRKNKK